MTANCFHRLKSVFVLVCLWNICMAQVPSVSGVEMIEDGPIVVHNKVEFRIDIEASYQNPYDYDEVAITAVFTSPGGEDYAVDGFYMEEFAIDTENGSITPLSDSGVFKLRFAPAEVGEWSYQVSVQTNGGISIPFVGSFVCTEGSVSQGFVRQISGNYLQFDNGDQYIPIGENIAWQDENAIVDYQNWLTKLSDNGGNFFRLWHAHWGLGIEWSDGWGDFAGLRSYNQRTSVYQDWLLDFCAAKNIYVMMCLQHHGQVSTAVNPEWNTSPYNVANGGPCNTTREFFTDSLARAHTRNRLRYIVARWGYSRNILCWELFNEVGWTDAYDQIRGEVAQWHFEMADYLGANDPYKHLITTSFARESQGSEVWSDMMFDFTQSHVYMNHGNLERAVAAPVRNYLTSFEKPTLTGEFGLGPNSALANQDVDGIHIHNSMFASLFAGGLGTAMSWWWDSYIEPRNLYYHFRPVSTIVENIPFVDYVLSPGSAQVTGAPDDLSLIPTLDWSGIGDSLIVINERGRTMPEMVRLGQFLYGSEWNTEFRSPPVFSVEYNEPGVFSVETGENTGQNPIIAIYLNDELVLREIGSTRSKYQIEIPEGSHEIRVDNEGTDWITISAYVFEGLGSAVDVYNLISSDGALAAGWLLNHRYNHQFIAANGQVPGVIDATLQVDNVLDGTYQITWFECLSGSVLKTQQVNVIDGILEASIPDLSWDLVYLVEGITVNQHRVEIPAFDVSLYPNPVSVGDALTIELPQAAAGAIVITVFDVEGRLIFEERREAQSLLSIPLPTSMTGGYYWIKVQARNGIVVKPLVVK